MEQGIGRPRLAKSYAWLISFAALVVIVQGFLFAAFYSEAEKDFLEAHGLEGELMGYIIVVALVPLGFLSRFPRSLQMGWWTVGLALVWNIQAHVFGFGIEDVRWFEMIHIPLAILIFGLTLYLAVKAHRAIRESG